MKKLLQRTISWIVAVSLVLGTISVSESVAVYAQKKIEKDNIQVYDEPTVVEEIVNDRTSDSTTVLLSNGMKQTTYYSDDIYYQK